MSGKLVLLANLGSPNDLTEIAVQDFLESMLSDKYLLKFPWYMQPFQKIFASSIAKKRAKHSLEMYKQTKGKSILLDITNAQAKALENKIKTPVKVVMRHSEPSIQNISEFINTNNIQSCQIIPLFPQYSTTTTESSFQEIKSFLQKNHPEVHLTFVQDYYDHELFIGAWVENIKRTLRHLNMQRSTVLVFSAHGIPESYLTQGDDKYLEQLQVSMRKITEQLPQQYKSVLSFQSKFGKQKWLEPSTIQVINSLAAGTQIVLIPISFVSEHLETRYEMDIEFKQIAEERNLIFKRVPALNCSEKFINCLASLFYTHNYL